MQWFHSIDLSTVGKGMINILPNRLFHINNAVASGHNHLCWLPSTKRLVCYCKNVMAYDHSKLWHPRPWCRYMWTLYKRQQNVSGNYYFTDNEHAALTGIFLELSNAICISIEQLLKILSVILWNIRPEYFQFSFSYPFSLVIPDNVR